MTLRNYEKIKGVFICIAFIGAGLSLLNSPTDLGTAAHIVKVFPIDVFALGFIIFGLINLVTTWLDLGANALWFAPFYGYYAATILAYMDGNVPLVAVFLYGLLVAMLTLDVVVEIRGNNG